MKIINAIYSKQTELWNTTSVENLKNIEEACTRIDDIYYKLPSYDKMKHSFWKPLKPKYWLSEEDYETLKPYLQ